MRTRHARGAMASGRGRASRALLAAAVVALGVITAAVACGCSGGRAEPGGRAETKAKAGSEEIARGLQAAGALSKEISKRAAALAAGKQPASAAADEASKLVAQNAAAKRDVEALKVPEGAFDPRTGILRALSERAAELAAAEKLYRSEVEVAAARATLSTKEKTAATLAAEAQQNPNVSNFADAAAREVAQLRKTIANGEAARDALGAVYTAARERAEAAAGAWDAL